MFEVRSGEEMSVLVRKIVVPYWMGLVQACAGPFHRTVDAHGLSVVSFRTERRTGIRPGVPAVQHGPGLVYRGTDRTRYYRNIH